MPRGEYEHWYEQTALLPQYGYPRVGGGGGHPLWSP